MIFDEIDQYTQNLLLAQYDIAEIIQHEVIKGEVREDFLIFALQSRFDPKPAFRKGTLSDGNNQPGQIDTMLCRPNCQIYPMGSQAIIRPEDCLCLIEVKGNATGTDIRDFNRRVETIRLMKAPSHPLCGIFCYKVQLKEKTILNRFGFEFSTETQTYYDDDQNPLPIEYPLIDFFISLDEDCPLFLRKMDSGRFVRIYEFPIIKNLYQIIQSLMATAKPSNSQPN